MGAYTPDVDVVQLDAATVVHGLLAEEATERMSLMVIATHARQGTGRLILGNVADEMVRRGRLPVMVIPPLADAPMLAVPHVTRVLVPLDGSSMAEQALRPILGWLGASPPSELAPRDLMLLAVAEDPTVLQQAEVYLERVANAVEPCVPSVEVSTHAAVGEPSRAIVSATDIGMVRSYGDWVVADLIVMATHGRGGVARYLYGSVASYVVPRVRVPVLLVHAPSDKWPVAG
jgi:nucleotide-binding universal stress UspA family protein